MRIIKIVKQLAYNSKYIKTGTLAATAFFLLSACQDNSVQVEENLTDFTNVINSAPTVCQSALKQVGSELITHKTYNLLPTFTSNHMRSFTGTLNYNDRPSQFHIDAIFDDKQCQVRYRLDYLLDMPCVEAREDAFSKWIFTQKLDDHTERFVHKRHPTRYAYLTDIDRNQRCLIAVSEVMPTADE